MQDLTFASSGALSRRNQRARYCHPPSRHWAQKPWFSLAQSSHRGTPQSLQLWAERDCVIRPQTEHSTMATVLSLPGQPSERMPRSAAILRPFGLPDFAPKIGCAATRKSYAAFSFCRAARWLTNRDPRRPHRHLPPRNLAPS